MANTMLEMALSAQYTLKRACVCAPVTLFLFLLSLLGWLPSCALICYTEQPMRVISDQQTWHRFNMLANSTWKKRHRLEKNTRQTRATNLLHHFNSSWPLIVGFICHSLNVFPFHLVSSSPLLLTCYSWHFVLYIFVFSCHDAAFPPTVLPERICLPAFPIGYFICGVAPQISNTCHVLTCWSIFSDKLITFLFHPPKRTTFVIDWLISF